MDVRFIIILHLFFLITVSCSRKSISPPTNKAIKEKSHENKVKIGNPGKRSFFGKKKNKEYNSVNKEQGEKSNVKNLFSAEGHGNSSGKAGDLFASRVEKKNGSNSGSLFSSGYKEKKNYGVKGKEGKKALKKRKWKLFKKKSAEEKSMEAENTRLFKKTNNSNEQKNRQKKIRFREDGLFQRGVMPN